MPESFSENQRLVIEAVRKRGASYPYQIAKDTGLPSNRVNKIVHKLCFDGVLPRCDPPQEGDDKPTRGKSIRKFVRVNEDLIE